VKKLFIQIGALLLLMGAIAFLSLKVSARSVVMPNDGSPHFVIDGPAFSVQAKYPNALVYEDRVYSVGPMNERLVQPQAQSIPWGIKKIGASLVPQSLSQVVVCVVDTGVDYTHPDLKAAIVGAQSYVEDNNPMDNYGHGTHVAGTIGAINNTIGVVGVSQVKILSHKALDDSGSGYGSWIADAINGCVDKGASVINMSLGSPKKYGSDPVIEKAIRNAFAKGVVSVCAAGNDGGPVGYPASQKECVAVSALSTNGRLAHFSSRGPEIDVIAPGVGILSTTPNDTYSLNDGTSMATPHVAGAFAYAIANGKKLKFRSLPGMGLHKQGKGLPDLVQTMGK
jgi:subtilisin family serine protease